MRISTVQIIVWEVSMTTPAATWQSNPPEQLLKERFHINTGFHPGQRDIIRTNRRGYPGDTRHNVATESVFERGQGQWRLE